MTDFSNLLDLARRRALDGKAGLACAILEACFAPRSRLAPQEMAIVYDILRRVVDRVEMDIRRRIADSLAPRTDVPRDLIHFLAHDAVPVAYPILRDSGLLDDEILLSVIRSKDDRHRIVIAEFRTLSREVSDALAVHGNEEVLGTLLRNLKAQIRVPTLHRIADKARDCQALQAPLLGRPEMTADLATALYDCVGAALRSYIVRRFGVDPEAIRVPPAPERDGRHAGGRAVRQMRWKE